MEAAMATQLLLAKTGVAAFRLYSLRRTLQIWFEELDRALAAAHRYDQLRISCGSGTRASKAQQLFAELYGAAATPHDDQ
jgi:hypothetical protein